MTAEELIDKEDEAFERQEYEEAISYYTSAIALDPDFASACFSRGNARSILKHYEEAIADYYRAIALNPDSAGTYNNRGVARKYYEKVIHYFYLKDKISLLTYLSLYYYLQQRGRILGEELLDKGSEAVLMDVAKKFTATGASAIPGVLAVGTFGLSVTTIAVGLAGTYFAATGVHKLIKYLKEYGLSDLGAKKDYGHFKAFFMENTIEALLDIKTEGFIASKTRKVLEDFYNEYQYVLKAQSSG